MWQVKCCIGRVMNITLKTNTKIRYNGKDYSSVDELPAEARAAYERVVANHGIGSLASNLAGGVVTTRLTINGKTYSSSAELPATEKKLFEDAMQLVHDQTTSNTQTPIVNAPPAADTGWLTKRQIRLIAVVAAVLLGLALFLATR